MELHLSHANAHSGLILTSSIDFLLHRWIWKLWFQRAYCYGSFLGMNFISGHHMVSRDLTNYGWLLSSSFSSSQPDNYPPVLYQLPLTFLQIGNQKAGFSLDVLHCMEGCVCVCVEDRNLEQEILFNPSFSHYSWALFFEKEVPAVWFQGSS